MLRTPMNKAYIKRTIRPLYGWTQMTPKSMFLDPAWDRSVAIYPGMGMSKTSGDNVTLTGSSMAPYGLCGLYIGGDGIDEPLDAGINAVAVWVLGPDAEVEILSPAFDASLTWTDESTPGLPVLVHVCTATSGATKRGQLVPAGGPNATTAPVGRLLKVNSTTKITVGGLQGTAA